MTNTVKKNKLCKKNSSINKNKQLSENKKLKQIADKILTEYKHAFEVLGNGEI